MVIFPSSQQHIHIIFLRCRPAGHIAVSRLNFLPLKSWNFDPGIILSPP